MTRLGWSVIGAVAGCYCVYMCWLAGFQAGYEQGQEQAWGSARKAFVVTEYNNTIE